MVQGSLRALVLDWAKAKAKALALDLALALVMDSALEYWIH